MRWKLLLQSEALCASLVLVAVLSAAFSPVLFGSKTVMMAAWDAPSVMQDGAYYPDHPRPQRLSRSPDPGAPAWVTEPWLKTISEVYWTEHQLPLWNPYVAYGAPLAAAMQPQPFYPLTALLSLRLSPQTYNLFIVTRLFVGGILMFFFARLFLGLTPSLFAAITFMLSGYFITYLNMPHLSVEVLLPGIFLALELLLRRNSFEVVVLTAIFVLVSMTGGMPESLFLILSFGCAYFLFRLATTPEFRQHSFALLSKFVVAIVLGFALSAFLLLPFLEYVIVAHDAHQVANTGGALAGLNIDRDPRAFITYLLPLIFGPVGNSIFGQFSGWTGMRGYWGILPSLFAVAALICFFFPRHADYPKSIRLLTIFFVIIATIMLLKRFGHPAVNWIGELPLASLVVFPKYQEPLLAFCIATLAGIGFSILVEHRMKIIYFLVSALLVLGVMLALASSFLFGVFALKEFAFIYYLTLLAGVLIVLGAVFLLGVPVSLIGNRWLAWGFLGFLSVELILNFLAPSFYIFSSLPNIDRNPYAGAPYINFLKARIQDQYRVFGRNGVLYPNWAGAFGLADVRDLDAMYSRRYINFIRSFLLKPGDEARLHGELADRFTGNGGENYPYTFNTDKERRFLTLSSIKYIVSAGEYDTKILDEILSQHKGENIWGFGANTFPIGEGRIAAGLFHHPPSNRISYKTVIDSRQPIFEAVASIKTEAQDASDGVGFKLEIKSDGAIEPLFYALLNPKEVIADRSGRKIRLDLSRYAGKQVELLFSTDPGPKGNNSSDWAGWARLRFVAANGNETKTDFGFTEIYDREVHIYEVSNVLPRATLFYAAEIVPDNQVLSRLQAPSLDIRKKVVLSQESVSDQDSSLVRALNAVDSPSSSHVYISHYTSGRVRVEVVANGPAILMLNDTNYPGWHAYVNGRPVPIIQADYLFRGVIVSGGKSTVEFVYEPFSFRVGAGISIAALIFALGMTIAFRLCWRWVPE